ncbi:MAG: hypothetical protein NVS9B1_05670 [Candidatus Dormibacteraceae bacterium]
MSRMHDDPDLDGLFGADSELEGIARLLQSSRLNEAPLDPAFRNALRRQLVTAAYERRRPRFLAGLFGGPGFAFATAAVAVLLVAVIFIQNPALLGGSGSNQVVVRTLGPTQEVAVNQPITLSFSQPMDHQSVQSSIHIEPATQVSYQWQGNNLLIQPASGQLAANTQYHITVASTATTERGRPLGQAAMIAVNTAALPTPTPLPSASPSPAPRAAITSERNLVPNGTAVGWSSDGLTLFYLVNGGELGSIRSDGSGRRTLIGTGVTRAALSPDGGSLVAVAGGRLLEVSTGGGAETNLNAVQPPSGVGWQGSKVVYWTGLPGIVSFYLAGETTPLAVSPSAARTVVLAPDGSKVALDSGTSPANSTTPVAPTLTILDFTAHTQRTLTQAISGLAWDNGSARIAYVAGSALLVGPPDGTPGKSILAVPDPAADLAWTPSDQILVSSASGAWLVKPDGSGAVQLRTSGIGTGPAVAPGSVRAAVTRADGLWEVEIGMARKSALDLGAGASLVAQYLAARVGGDQARAGGLLTASAARTAPAAATGEPHLARYFLISSEATADNLRFLARLVFAKDANEVRYQDELLLVTLGAGGLQIDGIVDSPARDLGKGPTVNSVTVLPGGLTILFDSDLDPATAATAARITSADRTLTVAASYANRQLTLTAPLVAGHHYRLELSDQLRDIDRQPLQGGYTFDFVAPPATPPTP